jgi:hypothetical protein
MKRRIGLFAALAMVLAAGSVLLAQGNPFVGTWKLNLEKSKFNPGPAPQSQMRTWDAAGMVMVTGVGATGKAFSYGYSVKGDGKMSPTMGAIPNTADMISTKKIDANNFEATFTKAGKTVETTTFAVSGGGKTLTIHAKGIPEVGGFENVQVLDKQ